MKTLRAICVLIAMAVVAGCATGPNAKERFDVQVQLYKEQQEQQAKSRDFYAQIAARCATDTCAQSIAMTAMAEGVALNGGGGGGNRIPQYVPDRSIAAEFGLAALNLVPVVGQTLVSLRQSDNNVRTNRDQFSAWSNIIGNVTSTVADLQPNIQGGYIGGSVSGNGAGIGNAFTTSGNGNAIGDRNALDNSRGQINGNWNNNSGRANSPGRDNSPGPFVGGDCPGGDGAGSAGDPSAGGAGGNCSGGAPGGE